MKKRLFKRICILLALVLSLVMLSACTNAAKKDDENSSDQSSEQTESQSSEQPTEETDGPTPEKKADKTQLAKEGVYQWHDYTDEIANAISYEIITSGKTKDGFAFVACTDPYYEIKAYYCSAKNDGTDFQVTNLDFKPFLDEKDSDFVSYALGEYGTLTENNVFIALALVRNVDRGDKGWDQEKVFCVGCFDKSGSLLWKTKIDELSQESADDYYVSGMCGLQDGGVALILEGYPGGVICVDGKGTASRFVEAPKNYLSSYPRWLQGMDGTITLLCGDGWGGYSLINYDPAKNEFGSEQKLQQNLSIYANTLSYGEGEEIFYAYDEGVYSFRPNDADVKKIMDFVNSDLDVYLMDNLTWLDNTHFFASVSDDNGIRPCLFTYVNPETIPDKKTIVLGTIFFDWEDKSNVIKFNKSNDEYRIVIRKYNSLADGGGDYFDAMEKDLLSDQPADVILIQTEEGRDKYEEMGLFVNVDELIKKDATLGKLEYADNVWNAFRRDGKLYYVIPRFNFSTYIGKKSLLGNKDGITIDEALQMADKRKGASVFDKNGSASSWQAFLLQAMEYCGYNFVDFENGKCNFDTKEFRSILEFAKAIYDTGEGEWIDYYFDPMEYRDDKILLLELNVRWLKGYPGMARGILGEEVAYVGFPNENGTGAYVDFEKAYAISAKSENLDGAWLFLRNFLTEEFQEKAHDGSGLPVLKKTLENIVMEQMERPYWTDENGQKDYYDITEYYGDELETIEPLSQQEAEELMKFIESIKKQRFHNKEVENIVYEGAYGYVYGKANGSDSIEDVIDGIQERTQKYLDEYKNY